MERKVVKERSLMTELLQFALITAFIILPFRIFVAQPFVVNGSSMDPTFKNGQYLIVDQLTHKIKDINRGDVVVFKYPKNPKKYFIKRVIGLPGETISIDGHDVTIKNSANPSGFKLNEPYIQFVKDDDLTYTIDPDEYFVIGDNRAASFDSRDWQALPAGLVVGRPIFRLLPMAEAAIYPGDYDTEDYSTLNSP